MQEPFERLQEARRRARFASASDAARAFGWNENTYRSHENGERGLKRVVAERYARAFRVSSSWLMFGTGDSQSTFNIKLWACISSQRDILQYTPDMETMWFELPVFVSIDAFCLQVKGDKMFPRYADGDLIICSVATHHIENQAIEGVAYDDKQKKIFGTIYGDFDNGFSIETINAPTVRKVKLSQFMTVDAVVRSGRYFVSRPIGEDVEVDL